LGDSDDVWKRMRRAYLAASGELDEEDLEENWPGEPVAGPTSTPRPAELTDDSALPEVAPGSNTKFQQAQRLYDRVRRGARSVPQPHREQSINERLQTQWKRDNLREASRAYWEEQRQREELERERERERIRKLPKVKTQNDLDLEDLCQRFVAWAAAAGIQPETLSHKWESSGTLFWRREHMVPILRGWRIHNRKWTKGEVEIIRGRNGDFPDEYNHIWYSRTTVITAEGTLRFRGDYDDDESEIAHERSVPTLKSRIVDFIVKSGSRVPFPDLQGR